MSTMRSLLDTDTSTPEAARRQTVIMYNINRRIRSTFKDIPIENITGMEIIHDPELAITMPLYEYAIFYMWMDRGGHKMQHTPLGFLKMSSSIATEELYFVPFMKHCLIAYMVEEENNDEDEEEDDENDDEIPELKLSDATFERSLKRVRCKKQGGDSLTLNPIMPCITQSQYLAYSFMISQYYEFVTERNMKKEKQHKQQIYVQKGDVTTIILSNKQTMAIFAAQYTLSKLRNKVKYNRGAQKKCTYVGT